MDISITMGTSDGWLNPSTLAAWVQAIGSVGAIIAAAWITNHDRAETAKADTLSKAKSLAAMMELALKYAHVIKDSVEKPTLQSIGDWNDGTIDEARRQLNRSERALRRVPTFALDDARLIEALLDFRDAINLIRKEVRAIAAQYKSIDQSLGPRSVIADFEGFFIDAEKARNTVLVVARGR